MPRTTAPSAAPRPKRYWMGTHASTHHAPRNTNPPRGVDLYVGGTEHAVLHLLYARFWHKVLFDLGHVSTPEPFFRLVNQGLILGEDGQKMSKSRGNVINPDDILVEYGADAFRLYEMFMGPLEMVKPWSTKGVEGVYRFLGRVWRLFVDEQSETEFEQSLTAEPQRGTELLGNIRLAPGIADTQPTAAQLKALHACIKNASLKKDLKGFKLGLPREYYTKGMDTEVENAVRQTVEQCRQLGAEIVDVSLPHTEYAISAYYIIATAEASANLARFDGVRYGFRAEGAEDPIDMYGKSRAQGFGPEVKRRIILGTYVLSSGYYDAYYLSAQKVRTLIRGDFEDAFKKCDALLTPVSPTPAYRLGEKTGDPLQMYLGDIFTVTANLAGICGMSVPCGLTKNNLPIGLQIIGPAFKEENIIRAGYAFESKRGKFPSPMKD